MTGKCRLHTLNTIGFASPDRNVFSQYRSKAIRRHLSLWNSRHLARCTCLRNIISENHRISIPSILSRPGSFSIRFSFEPTHPSRPIPWIIQISREIDDRSFRFAEIQIQDKGRICAFVFQNFATFGHVLPYALLLMGDVDLKNLAVYVVLLSGFSFEGSKAVVESTSEVLVRYQRRRSCVVATL